MYSIISSLATPIIIINATRVYNAWDVSLNNNIDKVCKIYKQQTLWNAAISATIFLTGSAAVVMHATKFQKPTPLIMSAMAYRLVAIFITAFATGYSGQAVNNWFLNRACETLKPKNS